MLANQWETPVHGLCLKFVYVLFANFLKSLDPLLHKSYLKKHKKGVFENIVGKGENADDSIFSFSNNVFYTFLNNLNVSVTIIMSFNNAFIL